MCSPPTVTSAGTDIVEFTAHLAGHEARPGAMEGSGTVWDRAVASTFMCQVAPYADEIFRLSHAAASDVATPVDGQLSACREIWPEQIKALATLLKHAHARNHMHTVDMLRKEMQIFGHDVATVGLVRMVFRFTHPNGSRLTNLNAPHTEAVHYEILKFERLNVPLRDILKPPNARPTCVAVASLGLDIYTETLLVFQNEESVRSPTHKAAKASAFLVSRNVTAHDDPDNSDSPFQFVIV
jgi:hypothetical protein